MDIRNNPSMFQKLVGCRVVEGFLQILLFDNYNETDYANLSFPELREITGYLMMYRVNGLRTLANLFPNLAVIRGHKLFNDYAFILYEMMHMQVCFILYFIIEHYKIYINYFKIITGNWTLFINGNIKRSSKNREKLYALLCKYNRVGSNCYQWQRSELYKSNIIKYK